MDLHGGNGGQAQRLAEWSTFVKIHRAGNGDQAADRRITVPPQVHQTQQPAHAVAHHVDGLGFRMGLYGLHRRRKPAIDVGVQVQAAIGVGRFAPIHQVHVVTAGHQITDHGTVGHQVIGPAVNAQRWYQQQGNAVLVGGNRENVVVKRDFGHRREAVMSHSHNAITINLIPRAFIHLDKALRVTPALHNVANGSQAVL